MLEADNLFDRRRLKRRLSAWRAAAIIVAVLAVILAIPMILPAGVLPAGKVTGAHVAKVEVAGLITGDPDIRDLIDDLAEDPAVRAIVVEIDSPGGTVVGSEVLYKQLRRAAETKPVVAQMGTTAASGGYMLALGADHIVAHPGTITGSIGVILHYAQVQGLMNKLGVEVEAVKSGPLKAEPSPFEKPSPVALAVTRGVVDDMYQLFVDMVAERRELGRQDVYALADGRIYTGRQALDAGLIDALGGREATDRYLATGRGLPEGLPWIDYEPEPEDRDVLDLLLGATGLKTLFPEPLRIDGLLAVWHPSLID